ncbi:uncharacterized protein LOC119597849 [Penaeus monodon]|uniref:uncharacterized protein LOC119597849 n=1 Tax=Penaeus monodon TaxID=6687 RepID=UPI0018A7721C|nr:uncharacterized protein LOC119597849 [Penaeus monodon]
MTKKKTKTVFKQLLCDHSHRSLSSSSVMGHLTIWAWVAAWPYLVAALPQDRTSLAEVLRSSPAWAGVDRDSCTCRERHDPCPVSLPLSRELLTKVGVVCIQSLQFCCDFKTQQKERAAEKSSKPQTHSNTASKKVQSITDKEQTSITSLGVVPSGQEITKNSINDQQKGNKITQHVLEENASSLQGTDVPELHVRTKKENKKETVNGVTQPQISSENKNPKNDVSGLDFEAEELNSTT